MPQKDLHVFEIRFCLHAGVVLIFFIDTYKILQSHNINKNYRKFRKEKITEHTHVTTYKHHQVGKINAHQNGAVDGERGGGEKQKKKHPVSGSYFKLKIYNA